MNVYVVTGLERDDSCEDDDAYVVYHVYSSKRDAIDYARSLMQFHVEATDLELSVRENHFKRVSMFTATYADDDSFYECTMRVDEVDLDISRNQ